MLNEIPGSESKFLKIDKNLYNKSLKDRIKSIILRHHTQSIMFDENGSAIEGKQDFAAKNMSFISKSADNMPSVITDTVGYIASTIFNKFTYEKEDGTIGFKLPFSKKGNKRVYKESNIGTKCGELIKKFVGNIQTSAKELQNSAINSMNYIRNNGKNGRSDVAYAAATNNNFNRIGYDNFSSIINNKERNKENDNLTK